MTACDTCGSHLVPGNMGIRPQTEDSGAVEPTVSTNPMKSTRKGLREVLDLCLDHFQSLAFSH